MENVITEENVVPLHSEAVVDHARETLSQHIPTPEKTIATYINITTYTIDVTDLR